MPDADNLLTLFYQLNGEARKEVVDTIQVIVSQEQETGRTDRTNIRLA